VRAGATASPSTALRRAGGGPATAEAAAVGTRVPAVGRPVLTEAELALVDPDGLDP